MSEKIVAFSGKQFSGKDTVAKILLENMPEFKRIALGDAIKIEYGESKGLTYEQIEKNKAQYRPDLIALGNKRRSEDPDYWLKKVLSMPGNIMVPDIRVKHELEIFKEHNAFTVRVNASIESRAKRGTLVKEDDKTETDLDDIKDWDFVIENDSDYETLVDKTLELKSKIENWCK